MRQVDVVVIGAGAAGMMCAAVAGQRGLSVVLIDHLEKPGEKIRISGGGRCNFTNKHASHLNFLSQNPHFVKSALKRYGPKDFIALVERYNIAYHEKTLGQLFCDQSSKQIIDLLMNECSLGNVDIQLSTRIRQVEKQDNGFLIDVEGGLTAELKTHSLVIATGGKSIPKMGATGFGYDVAKQFGLKIVDPSAALVPLTFSGSLLEEMSSLSGISADAIVRCGQHFFREGLLFTHRGLSGPSILQISSYWHEGATLEIDMLPDVNVFEDLKSKRKQHGKKTLQSLMQSHLPKRLVEFLGEQKQLAKRLADASDVDLKEIDRQFKYWNVLPMGSEGYRTAEVTLGGVDTDDLSSKTLEAKSVPGLYFIGEVVDVTGHLGGHNFQWAWSSAQAAGTAL